MPLLLHEWALKPCLVFRRLARRNPYPAHVFNNESHTLNLYDSTVEVDYKGSEVNVENFLRLLIGACGVELG